jgi:hypothetical protein
MFISIRGWRNLMKPIYVHCNIKSRTILHCTILLQMKHGARNLVVCDFGIDVYFRLQMFRNARSLKTEYPLY